MLFVRDKYLQTWNDWEKIDDHLKHLTALCIAIAAQQRHDAQNIDSNYNSLMFLANNSLLIISSDQSEKRV